MKLHLPPEGTSSLDECIESWRIWNGTQTLIELCIQRGDSRVFILVLMMRLFANSR